MSGLRITIYTLTRERLEFTQHCFGLLERLAGYPYEHVVVDNGSRDGSVEWLREWVRGASGRRLLEQPDNRGISVGSNLVLEDLARAPIAPDLVIKFDNDCEPVTPGIVKALVDVFADQPPFASRLAVSPRVEGIVHQPARIRVEGRGGYRIGVTGMIGGLFHVVPWPVYRLWRYPRTLPKAHGQDDVFCHWLNRQGVVVGYVEELVVRHYLTTDGQARRFPEYFARKFQEEKA